jgi:hypothetical protein
MTSRVGCGEERQGIVVEALSALGPTEKKHDENLDVFSDGSKGPASEGVSGAILRIELVRLRLFCFWHFHEYLPQTALKTIAQNL